MNRLLIAIALCIIGCSSQKPQLQVEFSSAQEEKVNWSTFYDGETFLQAIRTNDRTVALLGSKTCQPCKIVLHWWERQPAPEGWSFVYWEIDESRDFFSFDLKEVFQRYANQPYLTMPYLSLIERRGNVDGVKEIILADFHDSQSCTKDAFDFLHVYSVTEARF